MTRRIAGQLLLTLCLSALVAPAQAAGPDDATLVIRQFLDAFNKGDMQAANSAYAAGDINIVDEFPPHRWTGANAAHAWAADYDKRAAAMGVSEGLLAYEAPTRTEIESTAAYVVVPAVYRYKEHGNPLVEEGRMTFVLHKEKGRWKIRAWTWSGAKPHPAK